MVHLEWTFHVFFFFDTWATPSTHSIRVPQRITYQNRNTIIFYCNRTVNIVL